VFSGYWRNDAATAEVLEDDGWFHTGDVGEVDDEGFVRITGRKKEILVTAGGKNVAPAVLEDRVRAHALVDQCLVVGDGPAVHRGAGHARPRGGDRLGRAARQDHQGRGPGRRPRPPGRARDRHRGRQQGGLQGESIRKFASCTGEWTEEGGQLTPSLKLKRDVVLREHRDDVAISTASEHPRILRTEY
jgi:long-chain acyl-CoA synthetase